MRKKCISPSSLLFILLIYSFSRSPVSLCLPQFLSIIFYSFSPPLILPSLAPLPVPLPPHFPLHSSSTHTLPMAYPTLPTSHISQPTPPFPPCVPRTSCKAVSRPPNQIRAEFKGFSYLSCVLGVDGGGRTTYVDQLSGKRKKRGGDWSGGMRGCVHEGGGGWLCMCV